MLWMDDQTLRVLEPDFQRETWLLAAYDPLAPWGTLATECFELFFGRYSTLNLVMGMLAPISKGATEFPKELQEWISHTHYRHVLVGDPGAQIALALGASSAHLNLLVISGGNTVVSWSSLVGPFLDFELRFQQWLRKDDPGLPLIDPAQDKPWPKLP